MRTRLVTVLLATLTVWGCSSTGGSSGSGRSADFITSEELRGIESTSTDMYDAIQRLRPLWLRSRGSSPSGGQSRPVVYMSGSRYGDVGTLRGVLTTSVREARFMDASTATTRFGTGHVGGAILITLHAGR